VATELVNAAVATAWLRDGRRVVSALLVEVEGSAPLPAGAGMLIDASGAIEGSITGGCVEAAVVHEAEAVLAGGPPRVAVYGISDELAGTAGLACGGTVHVFVHELSGAAAAAELAALAAVVDGRPAAVATMLDGPTAGAKLALVDGEAVGSLRGPALLDRSAAREAAGLLDHGVTALCRFGADGAVLGADLRVHVRSHASPSRMVIVGAIDFSAALAALASEVGYAVTICDPRERFLASPRFAAAAEVVVGWPDGVLAERRLGPRDAILVFSHDPKIDEPALVAALATDAGYVGALGSRRTTADRHERLRAAGIEEAALARVHAPCGLDIGGRTPEEVAISVLAEIVAERSGRAGEPLRATTGSIRPRDEVAPPA